MIPVLFLSLCLYVLIYYVAFSSLHNQNCLGFSFIVSLASAAIIGSFHLQSKTKTKLKVLFPWFFNMYYRTANSRIVDGDNLVNINQNGGKLISLKNPAEKI